MSDNPYAAPTEDDSQCRARGSSIFRLCFRNACICACIIACINAGILAAYSSVGFQYEPTPFDIALLLVNLPGAPFLWAVTWHLPPPDGPIDVMRVGILVVSGTLVWSLLTGLMTAFLVAVRAQGNKGLP
jgi:hypothetical protein